MRRTCLVAGGAGFIGSHLCAALLAQENRVVCIDCLSTGSRGNLERLALLGDFTFIEHDITRSLEHLDLPPCDEIYNLACSAAPLHYRRDPLFTLRTCFLGTMGLLDLARRDGARFLQASTSEVYGDPEIHPQRETYWGHVNPIGKRACYDEGKRVAETLCIEYAAAHGVDIRVIRIFNTYGPNMRPDDGRVVCSFIVQALSGQDLTVYGDGTQTRSLCYVDDMIDGILAVMAMPSRPTGPINLGMPEEYSVLEIAQLVLSMIHTRSRIVFRALPEDDPRQRRPDIAKARSLTGWDPKISLRTGLAETIAYFEAELASVADDA